jgi:aminopeptidase N
MPMSRLNRIVPALLLSVQCAAASAMAAALPATGAAVEKPFSFDATPGQLPKNIVPQDYALHIVPDFEKFSFTGSETIRIQVRQPSMRIMLNALDLEVQSATLGAEHSARKTLKPVLDANRQTLSFELDAPLAPGSYELQIEYSGRINPQPQGLYYDRYPTAQGQKVLIGTQMEPTDARRMLPCWDEPAFRASFQLSVDLPAQLSAYSNMPAEQVEQIDGQHRRIRFGRTPKMASYLIVLVAGELERLESEQDGVKLGIVTTENKRASAQYALNLTRDLLHYYNDYFGIRYPLPKLDQIAVPGGFGGAMENWGGIVYNETTLLYDPEKSSEHTKRLVYDVVAHEMAHQWFGDLVTMAWWDNLWLNEGFASWMGTKAADHFNPDWQVWLHANSERESAMSLDARKTTHPIQQPVDTESQANDAFDSITYLKGQSFLRMLETWLGADVFRAGIRSYMAAHQYSSTTTANLWSALEQASGKPVRRIAQAWTEQPGFPLVRIEASCKSGTRRIRLSQEQFRVDEPGVSERLWPVPLLLGAAEPGAHTEAALLDGRSLELRRPRCDETLLLDPDAVGYYRVEYAPALFKPLAARLPQLQPGARLKLLSDSWALAGVGRLALADYLHLLAQLGAEPERAVWDEVGARLDKLDTLAQREPVRPALQAYAVKLLRPTFDALGWEPKPGESDETRALRAALIAGLGKFGDRAVIAEAQARFKRFLDEPASLLPSLADAVSATAGRYADTATYQALRSLLRGALSTEEKRRYLGALCGALDPKLAQQTLDLGLIDSLPPALGLYIPAMVASRGEHLDLAWAYAKQNGAELLKRVAAFQRNNYFGGMVSSAADDTVADDLIAFVKAQLPADALTETERSASAIRFNAQLKARLLPQLAAVLESDSVAGTP